MSGLVPQTANEFIEQQLAERLTAVGEAFSADVLAFCGPIGNGVDDLVRDAVEALRQSAAKGGLVIVLTTDGGYIEVVQRIVDTLRHHYDHVSFVVPDFAFSAGTVLVMSGDAIFMDYYS